MSVIDKSERKGILRWMSEEKLNLWGINEDSLVWSRQKAEVEVVEETKVSQ